MFMLRQEIDDGKQNTSSAGRFDSHGGAPVQYEAHRPMQMQHVQGYTGSLWMPPLCNYSICIAPAAARATANETIMKQYTNFAGNLDGHGNVLVCCRTTCPMEEVQGFTRSHLMLPLGKYFLR
jgi:hypothetical protein